MAIELSREQIKRREELTIKLRDKTINPYEAEELKRILEIEKEQATALNDLIAIFAIAGLLYILYEFISSNERKIKQLKFRFPF
jgi:hypothetical protein